MIVGNAIDETENGTEDETKNGTENGTGRGNDAVAVGDTVTEAEAETEDKTEDNTEEDDTMVEDTWSASHYFSSYRSLGSISLSQSLIAADAQAFRLTLSSTP